MRSSQGLEKSELWKEVVDKRAQQSLQLALSLKEPSRARPWASPATAWAASAWAAAYRCAPTAATRPVLGG